MKLALCTLIALTVTAESFGTAQYGDRLMLDGQEHLLHSNPLESYFSRHPERLTRSSITSSALWRGYVATFEIADGRLRVRDVTIQERDPHKKEFETKWVSVIDRAFPAGESRTLEWFTGFLILPQGEVKQYVHMGYASLFERYRLLFIRNGVVRADRVFTSDEYQEYKVQQFTAFTESERFKSQRAELEKRHGGSLKADYFLYIFDVGFPVETLIDYKDFRPNAVSVN